jgi:hypothetical protein
VRKGHESKSIDVKDGEKERENKKNPKNKRERKIT